MELFNLKQTCSACPSQWEATLQDGRQVYIRYRWGVLTVTASINKSDNIMDAVRGVILYQETLDTSGWSGDLSTADMLQSTGYKIA